MNELYSFKKKIKFTKKNPFLNDKKYDSLYMVSVPKGICSSKWGFPLNAFLFFCKEK